MIGQNSILRRIPPNLDPKQALFLDGIRHAAEFVEFAHRRLVETLTQLALTEQSGPDRRTMYTSAFLDAWSIVDAVDRFRALWSLLPGSMPAAKSPDTKTFADLSNSIRELRNVADHLATKADKVVARKGSALGWLSWFTILSADADGVKGLICTLMPGTLGRKLQGMMVNPAGRKVDTPSTGMIELSAGQHKANLSDIIPEMALRISALEAELEAKFSAPEFLPLQAADILLKVNIDFRNT